MANSNTIVKFKTGNKTNIATTVTPIEEGTVYFAVDENNNGSIYFDKNASTRILMGENYPPNTNTTYTYDGVLNSHQWTTTLSGSDGSVLGKTLTFEAGNFINLVDDTTNKKITISVAAGDTANTLALGNHTHSTSITTSTGTSQVNLTYGGKYALNAGGTSYIFTMPASDNVDTNYYHSTGSWNNLTYTATANGGAPELQFTIPTGTTSSTVALGNHTHNLAIETSTSTSNISLTHGGKYQLSAGGQTLVFTMPSDNNTTYTLATGDSNGQIKVTPSSGNAYNVDVKGLGSAAFTDSSDYAESDHTHVTSIATSTATSQLNLTYGGKYVISTGGTNFVFTMPASDNSDTNYYHSSGSWNGLTYKATNNGGAPDLEWTIPTGTTGTTVALGNHTHTTSIITSTGTANIDLAYGGKYQLSAGGTSYIFTLPAADNTNYYHSTGTWSGLTYTAVASGGAPELSFSIPTGTTGTTVALGNHTHTLSMATSTGNSQISLGLGGKYQLTAGGSNYVFTMPSHPTYTAAGAAAVKVGRDSTGHVVLGDTLTVSDIQDASSITLRIWEPDTIK